MKSGFCPITFFHGAVRQTMIRTEILQTVASDDVSICALNLPNFSARNTVSPQLPSITQIIGDQFRFDLNGFFVFFDPNKIRFCFKHFLDGFFGMSKTNKTLTNFLFSSIIPLFSCVVGKSAFGSFAHFSSDFRTPSRVVDRKITSGFFGMRLTKKWISLSGEIFTHFTNNLCTIQNIKSGRNFSSFDSSKTIHHTPKSKNHLCLKFPADHFGKKKMTNEMFFWSKMNQIIHFIGTTHTFGYDMMFFGNIRLNSFLTRFNNIMIPSCVFGIVKQQESFQ